MGDTAANNYITLASPKQPHPPRAKTRQSKREQSACNSKKPYHLALKFLVPNYIQNLPTTTKEP
jgi:hypothetical protein